MPCEAFSIKPYNYYVPGVRHPTFDSDNERKFVEELVRKNIKLYIMSGRAMLPPRPRLMQEGERLREIMQVKRIMTCRKQRPPLADDNMTIAIIIKR